MGFTFFIAQLFMFSLQIKSIFLNWLHFSCYCATNLFKDWERKIYLLTKKCVCKMRFRAELYYKIFSLYKITFNCSLCPGFSVSEHKLCSNWPKNYRYLRKGDLPSLQVYILFYMKHSWINRKVDHMANISDYIRLYLTSDYQQC